ncbi:MAG: RIP metalloprotease RseP [Deltaproteobacteria bacterium]|nr:RIP metalloprotease RseP [Deltaproteobacteria bacterium]
MEVLLSLFKNTGHLAFYYLLPFIIVLGIMVFFHELGHFIVAKLFNVKVLKFALGFGPKILAKVWGETEYSIRYIPLGGFVKMLGENEDIEEDEVLAEEDIPRAFNNKHPFKRMAIVVAGPFFNVLLAFLLYWGIFYFSGAYIRFAEIGNVLPDSPASRAGLLKGDVIKSIDGISIEDFLEIQEALFGKSGIPVEVYVERGNDLIFLTVIPDEFKQEAYGQEISMARIGIESSGNYAKKEFGPWGSMKHAAIETWTWITRIYDTIVKLLTGTYSINMMGGPIMIGQMTGEFAQAGLVALAGFMAMISVNLGIINLFPIPILDGGLILLLLVELLTGRPLNSKTREWVQKIGLSLIILLMAVVFYNDIVRVFNQFP